MDGMTDPKRSIRNVSPVAPLAVAACVWGAVIVMWPLWFVAAFIVAEEWWRSDGR